VWQHQQYQEQVVGSMAVAVAVTVAAVAVVTPALDTITNLITVCSSNNQRTTCLWLLAVAVQPVLGEMAATISSSL
jgi:hypothetical protein